MLQCIKDDKRAVLVPIIDVIDDKTLEYYHGSPESFQIGSFTWSGHFTWMDIPKREIKRRGSRVAPTNSPTMVIEKQFTKLTYIILNFRHSRQGVSLL